MGAERKEHPPDLPERSAAKTFSVMRQKKRGEKLTSDKTPDKYSVAAGSKKKALAKFNPLSLDTLAESMVVELLKQTPVRLDTLAPFEGPGVYAIYYTGSFEPYKPEAVANLGNKWARPIYVGKAKFERLKHHAQSIKQVRNLDIKDFWCRYLVTEEIFIPLCESLLIKRYAPIWNNIVRGFGPKVVGKERETQQTSMWDILHPGRPGRGSAPSRRFKSSEDILKKLQDSYRTSS
ncbi:MAG: Eco29kI family restriction endonuclease [Terriglobia bacterium]